MSLGENRYQTLSVEGQGVPVGVTLLLVLVLVLAVDVVVLIAVVVVAVVVVVVVVVVDGATLLEVVVVEACGCFVKEHLIVISSLCNIVMTYSMVCCIYVCIKCSISNNNSISVSGEQ